MVAPGCKSCDTQEPVLFKGLRMYESELDALNELVAIGRAVILLLGWMWAMELWNQWRRLRGGIW